MTHTTIVFLRGFHSNCIIHAHAWNFLVGIFWAWFITSSHPPYFTGFQGVDQAVWKPWPLCKGCDCSAEDCEWSIVNLNAYFSSCFSFLSLFVYRFIVYTPRTRESSMPKPVICTLPYNPWAVIMTNSRVRWTCCIDLPVHSRACQPFSEMNTPPFVSQYTGVHAVLFLCRWMSASLLWTQSWSLPSNPAQLANSSLIRSFTTSWPEGSL